MKRTKEEIKKRLQEVCNHFVKDGKALIKDKYDGVVKESRITAIYADNTVVLSDCVHCEYSIFKITLIPII